MLLKLSVGFYVVMEFLSSLQHRHCVFESFNKNLEMLVLNPLHNEGKYINNCVDFKRGLYS